MTALTDAFDLSMSYWPSDALLQRGAAPAYCFLPGAGPASGTTTSRPPPASAMGTGVGFGGLGVGPGCGFGLMRAPFVDVEVGVVAFVGDGGVVDTTTV